MISRGKKEWEATFDAVADLIFMVHSNGNIVRCNKAVINKLNSSYKTLIGSPFLDALRDKEKPGFVEIRAGEIEIPRLGGFFEVLVEKVTSEDPSRTIYLLHDISKESHSKMMLPVRKNSLNPL